MFYLLNKLHDYGVKFQRTAYDKKPWLRDKLPEHVRPYYTTGFDPKKNRWEFDKDPNRIIENIMVGLVSMLGFEDSGNNAFKGLRLSFRMFVLWELLVRLVHLYGWSPVYQAWHALTYTLSGGAPRKGPLSHMISSFLPTSSSAAF